MQHPPSDEVDAENLWTLSDLRRIRQEVDEQMSAIDGVQLADDEPSGADDSSSKDQTEPEDDGNEENSRAPPK